MSESLDDRAEQAEDIVEAEPTKVDELVNAVTANGIELFRSPVDAPYARLTVEHDDGSKHQEVWAIRSRQFALWLRRTAYRLQRRTPAKAVLSDAIENLAARAQFDGDTYPVHLRVAGHNFSSEDPEIYLDLCDDRWRVVRITRAGWNVIEGHEAPVRFRRPASSQPLPEPVRVGRLDELRSVINVRDQDWPVVVAFLVGCLHPYGPYFVLAFVGESDMGKSNNVEKVRWVVDPRTPKHRRTWKGESDLAIWTMNSYVIALDNLSSLTDVQSDQLCRVTTGGGFGARTLYTDADENVFEDERRMVVMSSIAEVVTREDLLSRAMVCEVPTITVRRSESKIDREFEDMHPRVLGALLDATVGALNQRSWVETWPTDHAEWPRPVDVVQWVTAAERTLGFGDGDIVKSWIAHRNEAGRTAVTASRLGRAILAIPRPWEGTPTELLSIVNEGNPAHSYLTRDEWPSSESVLGQRLRRLAPLLRQCGVRVTFGSTGGGHANRRFIRID
jgi:hypothetical protein